MPADWNAETADESLILSCQNITDDNSVEQVMAPEEVSEHLPPVVPSLATKRRRLRPVRRPALLRMLEQKLGCEIQRGKGSEVTIFRPGGRKFILGGHPRNTEVSGLAVKALLQRVGITPVEWFAVVPPAR